MKEKKSILLLVLKAPILGLKKKIKILKIILVIFVYLQH